MDSRGHCHCEAARELCLDVTPIEVSLPGARRLKRRRVIRAVHDCLDPGQATLLKVKRDRREPGIVGDLDVPFAFLEKVRLIDIDELVREGVARLSISSSWHDHPWRNGNLP